MNYKIDLSEQNQNLLINADVKVEDREYSADEIHCKSTSRIYTINQCFTKKY